MSQLDKLSASDILAICDEYRQDDYIDSLDRAELSRHFGGGSLNPECDDLGLVGDNNWLMGYKYLNRAFRQVFGLYTSDAGLFNITVKKAINPDRRRFVERVANRRINQVIRESRRFRYPYWSCCGDAVLYGTPYLYRANKNDWCPKYGGKPLMPRNAPADVNDPVFSRWAFRGSLSGREIMSHLKRANKTKGAHWNTKGLRDALKQLVKEHNPNEDHQYNHIIDEDDPETIEHAIQDGSFWNDVLGSTVHVYYFFQKDLEGKIDLYIVNRLRENATGDIHDGLVITRDKKHEEALLYFERARFKNVSECLWPMILDVKFGGKAQAHRALGLGRLNYEMDRKVSELINAGLAGLEHDFTPIYQALNGATPAQIDKFLTTPVTRGQVMPENIGVMEKQNNVRNYANLTGMMSIFDIAQGSNAAAHAVSGSGGRGPRELEVQALERQAENQQSVTARMEDWSEMGKPLAEAVVFALTAKNQIVEGDMGWEEKERLTDLLKSDGVLIEELDPALIEVSFRKHLGAGDNMIRLQRAEKKMQALQFFPPESQRVIIREWVEAVDESAERANELIPEVDRPNKDQLATAREQTAYALATGIAPQPNETDIPEIHATEHLTSATGVVQGAQVSGLDASAQNGLSALLEHAMVDVQFIAAKGQQDLAKQFVQQIQEIAAAAEQLSSPPPTPKEQAELALKERNQQLQEAKFQQQAQKQERQQGHREDVDGQRIQLQMHSEARKDRELALKEEQAIDERSASAPE